MWSMKSFRNGVVCGARLFALVLLASLGAAPRTANRRNPAGGQRSFPEPLPGGGQAAELAAGSEQTFQTDAQGKYTLGNLASGRSRLEARGARFATQVSDVA